MKTILFICDANLVVSVLNTLQIGIYYNLEPKKVLLLTSCLLENAIQLTS